MKRLAILSSLLMIFSLAFAAPVLAAAPANDVYAGREPIAIGDDLTVDTSEATTDADDIEMNANAVRRRWTPACGTSSPRPRTRSSGSTCRLRATPLASSSRPAARAVSRSWRVRPGATAFEAVAGETYAILAIDDHAGRGEWRHAQAPGGRAPAAARDQPDGRSLRAIQLAHRFGHDQRHRDLHRRPD